MSKEITYSPYAHYCILQIITYISENPTSKGKKSILEIIKKIEYLSDFPTLGIYLGNKQYKYIINKNYVIYYKILNSNIYILSVKHVKNN